jgi:putative ABC transport system permease protein
MSLKLPVAWLHLSKEKASLLVAMAGISFANILMFMQLGFKDALYDSNTKIHRSLRGELFLISTQSECLTYMESFSQRRLDQTLGAPGVESVNPLYVDVIRWKNPYNRRRGTILALGVNPSSSPLDLPDIQKNINLTEFPDMILFDQASSPKFGTVEIVKQFEQGNRVITEVGFKRVEIGGLFTLGNSFAADGNFVTSDLNFSRFFPERNPKNIEVGVIHIKPTANVQAVQEYLKNYLPNDVRVFTKQEFIDFEENYWSSSTPIGYLFNLGAVMGFIVGAVIVYQILYTDVSNHLAEYATLKAIGYPDSYLVFIVLQEVVILVTLGYLPGFIISSGLYSIAHSATLLPINMKVSRAVLILFLTTLMCFVAGLLAVLKIRDADPSDIF